MTKLYFLISLITLLLIIFMLEGCAQLQTPEAQTVATTVVEKVWETEKGCDFKMLRDFPDCLQKLTAPVLPADPVKPATENGTH